MSVSIGKGQSENAIVAELAEQQLLHLRTIGAHEEASCWDNLDDSLHGCDERPQRRRFIEPLRYRTTQLFEHGIIYLLMYCIL